jgi:hypothetical protein
MAGTFHRESLRRASDLGSDPVRRGSLSPVYDALIAKEEEDLWGGRVGDFSAVKWSSQGSSHSDAQYALCEILKHPPLGNCLGSPTPECRVMSERL